MTDEQEEVEAPAVEEAGTTDPSTESDVEAAANAFLDLESDLAGGALPGRAWGQAVDVERIPAAAVPADYPHEIRTDEAIALRLTVDDRETAVYFEWGGSAPDDRLGRLLAVKNIPANRFADLHGESILLEVVDGHYVPCVPDEPPRGSPRGVYGVAAGLGVNLLVAVLSAVGLGGTVASLPVVVLWLTMNVLALPAATYVDAWHLRTRTDWDGGPLFWAALAAIPGVNVVSSGAYLYARARAEPLA